MPKIPRLNKAEKAVQERMFAMLEWGSKHPSRWHNVGTEESDTQAAKLLEDRGVVEVSWIRRQYKLTPKD